MPNAVVKSYAKETGKSEERIERWWKEAEKQALKKFKKSDPRFYAYVNGIVEKRGKLVHGKRKKKRKTNESLTWEKFQMLVESYNRVIPRDLFNDGNLLKCYGQLFLNLEKMGMEEMLQHDGDPFNIEQTDDGDTYISNIQLGIGEHYYGLSRPINSRQPFPLYLTNQDGDMIDVFTDAGAFSEDMKEFLKSVKGGVEESVGRLTFKQFLARK